VGEPPPGTPARATGSRGRFSEAVVTAIDRLDRWQQRHPLTAVPSAVVRKYSDDQAGRLSAQISYAAFLAIFPLLLVLLTVVGVFLRGHQGLQDDIIDSALRQFPVLGPDLKTNVHQLSGSNQLALVVGLAWLLYGSTKLSRNSQAMMAVVWGIDRRDLPSFRHWIPRAAGFLVVLGVGFVAGGALAGLGAFGRLGSFSAAVGLVLSLVVNVVMYWAAFVILIRIPHEERSVWPGAVIGGAGWTLLQFVGAQLVSHQLRHLSNLYGTFASILGLMWWIALGAMITVFAAESNVVLTRHLWPVSFRRGAGTPVPPEGAAPTGSAPPQGETPTGPAAAPAAR
jgi:YihY family inner membrane protein